MQEASVTQYKNAIMKIHKMCGAATSSLRDLGYGSHGRQCLNGVSKDKSVFFRCGRELPMQN